MAGAGSLDERCIDRQPLGGRATGKQPQLRHRILVCRHDLLDPRKDHMNRWDRRGEPTVSLVGDHHHGAGFGDQRVRARDTHARLEEDIADGIPRGVDLLLDVVAGDLPFQPLAEDLTDLLPGEVDRRHHHMTGTLPPQLDDPLAEVGLHRLDAVFGEDLVQLDLLGDHRFRLRDQLHAALDCEVADDPGSVVRVFREMDDRSRGLRGSDKLVEVVIEVVDRLGFRRFHATAQGVEIHILHHIGA